MWLQTTGNTNSNRLKKVIDNAAQGTSSGFSNGASGNSDDYTYDLNGNMTSDKNKGITSIDYNHLNLPTKIKFNNSENQKIEYLYNASGVKVKKKVTDGSNIKEVDYLDGFQYAGSVLQFFPTAEGYVKATPTDRINSDYHFNYIYNYTDHLGNVRVSYTLDPQTGKLRIVDEHHYYPFGLRHEVHYPSGNRLDFHPSTTLNGGQVGDPVQLINVTKTEYMYRYQGQERQDELGLNWDSFKWRNYDYAIGRFFNVDPLSEKFRYMTSYQFDSNNPIWMREIEGLEGIKFQEVDKNGKLVRHIIQHKVGVVTVSSWDKKQAGNKRSNNRVVSNFTSYAKNKVEKQLNSSFNGNDGKGRKNSNGEIVFFQFDVQSIIINSTDNTTFRELRDKGIEQGIESGDLRSDGKPLISPMQMMVGVDLGSSIRGNNSGVISKIGDENDGIAISHETAHQLLTRGGEEEHELISTYDFQLDANAVDAMLEDAHNAKEPIRVIE